MIAEVSIGLLYDLNPIYQGAKPTWRLPHGFLGCQTIATLTKGLNGEVFH